MDCLQREALVSLSMASMNDGHKPVYPLFQKPSKSSVEPYSAQNSTQPDLPKSEPPTTDVPGNAKRGRPRKIDNNLNPVPHSMIPVEKVAVVDLQTGGVKLVDVETTNKARKRQRISPEYRVRLDDGRIDGNPEVESRSRPQHDYAEGQQVHHQYSPQISTDSPSTTSVQTESTEQHPRFNPGAMETSSATTNSKHYNEQSRQASDTATKLSETSANADIKVKGILRFNPKSGTLGSPPTVTKEYPLPIPTRETEQKVARPKVSKAKKRKDTASNSKASKTRIVTIHYGNLSTLGKEIDAIMGGLTTSKPLIPKPMDVPKVAKPTRVVGTGPASSLHPLFMPKPATRVGAEDTTKSIPSNEMRETSGERCPLTDSIKSPSRITRSKPNNLDVEAKSQPLSRSATPQLKQPDLKKRQALPFSNFAGFGSNNRAIHFPGATEPAWPHRDMVHVRGYDNRTVKLLHHVSVTKTSDERIPRSKKSKKRTVGISKDESIVEAIGTKLSIRTISRLLLNVDLDAYPLNPPGLRVATKHLWSGPTIQKHVRRELKTPLALNDNKTDDSEDEIQGPGPEPPITNPILPKLFKSLGTTMSAFDRSECECQLWVEKYAPRSATELLHNSREALILKEWLQSLTVTSVEGSSGASKHILTSKPERPTKRKRKGKKLDDFIVSSGEDGEGYLEEISDSEDSVTGSQSAHKTVVTTKPPKASGRFANGVVMSGPNGCGKSAAVFAVAKELGYEIFEINSASRRSGKDILDRVGDMTRNHLVQPLDSQGPDQVGAEEQRISDALDDDLRSGRQGIMETFFKANPSLEPKLKKPATPKDTVKTSTVLPKAPPKSQKQSLILLEEVDILYEEDKQFWATVMTMLINSKRPVIMTCTDEAAVPLDSLSLHAILRFSAAPLDVATDHLLLVAGNEGHVLRREAVSSLYKTRGMDLRASLTELNFWCQFGIGDNKGGVSWFYQRWPLDSDKDKYGKTLRVISEGSYEPGMGLISQDHLKSEVCPLDIEEQILHEVRDGWQIDLAHNQTPPDLSSWSMELCPENRKHNYAVLATYDDFTNDLSTIDILAGSVLATDNKVAMNSCIPELSPKAREDYIIAHEVLDATPLEGFQSDVLGADIASWVKVHSRNRLQYKQRDETLSTALNPPSEEVLIDTIHDRFSATSTGITRKDFSLAFDPISEPEKSSLASTRTLEASAFDRPMNILALDLAPYVRSIVSHDADLQEERVRLSNMLSVGGKSNGKRMRTTRAAISALEGGHRITTRKDKYFESAGLNPYLVLRTGLKPWLEAAKTELINMEVETGIEE